MFEHRPPTMGADDEVGQKLLGLRPDSDFEDQRIEETVAARLFGGPQHPTKIGRFTVLEQIGKGGAGLVYATWDPRLERRVAIKLLRDPHPRRLLREAKASARLDHPNVVSVYDVGELDGGAVYLAMELVDGARLLDWIARHRPDARGRLDLALQAGRGLAAAHAEGVVHRDFKPSNVLVSGPPDDPRVRVADFGLARIEGTNSGEPPEGVLGSGPPPESGGSRTSTHVGGTPGYMAPEQRRGEQATAASDQYSFCVTLFEVFAERRPELDPDGRLAEDVKRTLVAPVARVVERGLKPEPEDRFGDMQTLLGALPPGGGLRRGRVLAAAAGLALVIAGVSGAWAWTRPSPCEAVPVPLQDLWAKASANTDRRVADQGGAPRRLAWDKLRTRMDEEVAAWSRSRVESCEAARSGVGSGEFRDRALACFEMDRAELEAFFLELEEGEPAFVFDGIRALDARADSKRCTNATWLLASSPPPPPEIADEVQALRAQLARVNLGFGAIGWEASERLIDDLAHAADILDHEPLRLAVARERGDLLRRAERLEEADRVLREAWLQAERLGDDTARIQIALHLVRTHIARDESKAREWVRTALAITERVAPDLSLHARVLELAAEVAEADGDYARSWELASQALERQRRSATSRAGVADALMVQGRASYKLGEPERAAGELQTALATYERIFGPDHPSVAAACFSIGRVHDRGQRYEEAEALYLRARKIWIEAHGPDNTDVARARAAIAGLAEMRNEFALADSEYRAAIDIFTRKLGPRSSQVATTLENLSIVHARQGDFARAVELLGQAIEIGEANLGPDHPELAYSLNNLGVMRIDMGDYAQAEAPLKRSIEIRETELGPDHVRLAVPLENLAEIERETGRFDDARATLARALSIVEAKEGKNSKLVVSLLISVGQLELADDQPEAALEPLARAVTVAEAPPRGDPYELGWAQFTWAKALRDTGKGPQGLVAGKRALATFESLGPGADDEAGLARAWLSHEAR